MQSLSEEKSVEQLPTENKTQYPVPCFFSSADLDSVTV